MGIASWRDQIHLHATDGHSTLEATFRSNQLIDRLLDAVMDHDGREWRGELALVRVSPKSEPKCDKPKQQKKLDDTAQLARESAIAKAKHTKAMKQKEEMDRQRKAKTPNKKGKRRGDESSD